jgi:hypothetical protein
MSLLALVVGSMLAVFASVQRSEAFARDRSETLDRMRLTMQVLTKELRQATTIAAASNGEYLEIDSYINGAGTHIVYSLTGETLTRSVDGDTPVALQEDVVARGTDYPALFSYDTPASADAVLVTMDLRVHPPRRPDTTLKLEAEVRSRNRS